MQDGLYDDYDTKAIKNISKEIVDLAEPRKTITVTDGNDEFNAIEAIATEDDIDIPSDDGIAIDAPKKVKIITTSSNQLRLASNRIKRKYLHQKSRGILRKEDKKAADWLRIAGFLGTDDLETIDYDNNTNINDLDDAETINYNNDTNINDLDNVNLKKTLEAQIAAKTIVKKYRNLARKKPYQRPPQNTFDDLADSETIAYNNDTSISDLNDIAAGSKKVSGTQVAAKKIIKKYRNLAKKKAQKN